MPCVTIPAMKVLFLLLIVAAYAAAQDKAVPVEKEPAHHLALQNAYTRAYEVEVAPHASTLLHHHAYDYVYVVLGPADITNAVEGKEPVRAKLENGHVAFAKGDFSHVATNNAATPFRNVTIEILKPPKKAPAKQEERALQVGEGGLSDPVLDNQDVRVYDVQLSAGGMLHPQKYAHPMLLVAVSNLDVHQTSGQQSRMVKQKPGGLEWLPAGSYAFMNMGRQPQRFVLVEYK